MSADSTVTREWAVLWPRDDMAEEHDQHEHVADGRCVEDYDVEERHARSVAERYRADSAVLASREVLRGPWTVVEASEVQP